MPERGGHTEARAQPASGPVEGSFLIYPQPLVSEGRPAFPT